jgi:hypothetical protein
VRDGGIERFGLTGIVVIFIDGDLFIYQRAVKEIPVSSWFLSGQLAGCCCWAGCKHDKQLTSYIYT